MAISKIPNSGFETPFNSSKIINDISTLALREATAENRVAYSSNSSFVDVFQDSSGVTNFVSSGRSTDEYISSQSGVTKTVTRAKIYTDATAYAVWQFQGSNDDSSYTNLGNTISTSANPNAYADTGTFTNTTAYRYYQFYKTNSAQGGQYHREVKLYEGASEVDLSNASITGVSLQDFTASGLIDNNTSTIGFHTDSAGVGAKLKFDLGSGVNATGSFEGNTITVSSSVSSMGGLFTYQDNAGTNALNTDIILQLSADGGSNYTTATLTALPDFSSGIKMAKANDVSVTAGTSLKYKISFANQSSGSKEARIRGVSLQY